MQKEKTNTSNPQTAHPTRAKDFKKIEKKLA